MAIPFLNNIDLNQNQALNLRLHQLASAPSGVSGQVYYNTTNNRIGWHDGTAWQEIYPSTSLNTANTDVRRDASGNFAAGTITANLTGLASQATILATSQNFSITGKATAAAVAFNGSGAVALNVTALTAAPGDITLANNLFIVGNSGGVGAATAKTAIPLSGFGAAAADVSMGGYRITSLAEPTNGTDAATKNYVDATALGLDVKQSVRYASIAALPANTYNSGTQRITASANGAVGFDGFVPVVGDRVLVKNEGTASNNGIYTVITVGDAYVPFVLQRAFDFDSSVEASPGSFVFVEQGLNLADTSWVMTTDQTVVLDTTALNWVQFSGPGSWLAGRGLVLSGNTFHFAQSTAYTVGDIFVASGASTISALAMTGDVTINSSGVTAIGANKVLDSMIRQGGATSVIGRSANSTGNVTDITATADKQFLRRAGGVLGFGSLFFSGTLGAGTQASFTVTHNLGTQDCLVFVYQAASPFAQVFTDIEMATANTVTVRFAAAVLGTNYRAVVVGV